MFLLSKDSDKVKIKEIFTEFEKMEKEIFHNYFIEILETISNYSDAIQLANFMLKDGKN